MMPFFKCTFFHVPVLEAVLEAGVVLAGVEVIIEDSVSEELLVLSAAVLLLPLLLLSELVAVPLYSNFLLKLCKPSSLFSM